MRLFKRHSNADVLRTATVMVEGRTYHIPETWLLGATRAMGSTEAAIRFWHEQELLADGAEGARPAAA